MQKKIRRKSNQSSAPDFSKSGRRGTELLALTEDFLALSQRIHTGKSDMRLFHMLRTYAKKYKDVLGVVLSDPNKHHRQFAAICIQELDSTEAKPHVMTILRNFDLSSENHAFSDPFVFSAMVHKAYSGGMREALPLLRELCAFDVEQTGLSTYQRRKLIDAKISAVKALLKMPDEPSVKKTAMLLGSQLKTHMGRWDAGQITVLDAQFMKEEVELIGETAKTLFGMEYGNNIKYRKKYVMMALDAFDWLLNRQKEDEYPFLMHSNHVSFNSEFAEMLSGIKRVLEKLDRP
ncbi:MAG: hypothetical protein ABIG39_06475 [Candidatus Micrarchaeota archaeon]